MPPVAPTLADWLTQWRQATEAESAAIEQEAWDRVAACQEDKRRLRAQIETGAVGASLAPGDPLAGVVGDLLESERRNAELIARKMEQVRRQQADCQQAGRTLKGLQRAYASPATPAWQRYS